MYLLVCDIFCLFDRYTQFRSYTPSFSHCNVYNVSSIRYNLLVLSDKVCVYGQDRRKKQQQQQQQQQREHAHTHTCM